jgi:predicted AlkP superfamily pyrophosphatase or phosphodiesterase
MGNDHYRFGAMADASALVQATSIWSGEYLGESYGVPRFCWISFSLTDSAMHEGGPHSDIARAGIRDTDSRLGEVLDAIEARGVLDRTAFVVVADHGMEENDPELTGDWGDALRAAGIEHRDEASGFVYLGDAPDAGDVAYGAEQTLDIPEPG